MQISTVFASWQRYCTALLYCGRQPNFAALNRGRHLYSAGWPSRWALAHILVTKRSKASIDRHDQFELLKNYSDAESLLCRHVKGPIYLLYRCAGNNISHSDDICRVWTTILEWTKVYCYSLQSVTSDILKELHIYEYSYPLKGIFLSGSPADVPIAKHSILKELLFIW